MKVTLDTRIYPMDSIKETIEVFQKVVSIEVDDHSPNKVSLSYYGYHGNIDILKDEFLNYLLSVASVRL